MRVDPHRPVYHFTPTNWMNDPKPFYWDGAYHVFFQHNPDAPVWGNMHWGHAVSRDLVHWETLPIALAPTPGGPDVRGCWTGCVLRHAGRFHILYTGISRYTPFTQVQCLASSDDLVTWQKYAGNPVISEKPPGFGECFRDPQAWREGDSWMMVIGGELPLPGRGGAALLYRSAGDDLTKWEYLHPLLTGKVDVTGIDFECPDFFELGGKHVFLSSRGRTWWQVGTYDPAARKFSPERVGACDAEGFYAAKSLVDARGRRILFGWIRESRNREATDEAGWSGVLSMPRVLGVDRAGQVTFRPAEEVRSLRRTYFSRLNERVIAGSEVFTVGAEGYSMFELAVTFGPPQGITGVGILRSGDSPGVRIVYDPELKLLIASVGGVGDRAVSLSLEPGEPLALRVFVDHSVVEVFANDRACLTQRYYERVDGTTAIELRGPSGTVAELLEFWELKG